MDITEIMKTLRHRYPFLMVDRIVEYSENYVVGYKNVTINEPFFQGHFPRQGDLSEEPVMPGVLILESMGQVASILVAVRLGKLQGGMVAFLTGVDKARFRKPVRPGDQLVTRAELLKVRGFVGRAKVRGYVDNVIVAEGEFSFMVAPTLKKDMREEGEDE
ncbi:MAG: 3-hydroxyacyl-ACP dehydratase FabZ [Synergistaceae bacterium]|jgi:3-hydroxyacyl-[acyl-carrier-protein] dehydratase|nr:3-hydroxyacyl-ACP dehydratase FabZ [Synergistaceae bacterium]